MKRVYFHTTLASLVALAIYIMSGFLIRAITRYMDETFWRYFFASVLMVIFYGVGLLYFANIKGALLETSMPLLPLEWPPA